jgi:signal transduction histidine kinase/ActR/RegA family two-component response regulator
MVPIIPEILRSKVMVLAELFRKRSELQSLNARLADANRELAQANEALHEDRAREVHKLNESLRATNAELERANRELQGEIVERMRVEDRLREADRRKDEFLATLAHELRNPLAPIQSALNVRRLARPDPDPAERDLQSLLERQMRHLVRLVDDLLDVSRITRDRLELRPEVLTLAPVLEAAIETVQPLLDSAGQGLDLSIPDSPVFLRGDPQRLAQVFANLLSNASKFSAQGARIGLSALVAGDNVEVRVRDAGIGLDASQQAFIFDLFAQVDTSLERARGGLGIGLTLARRLVELHGGALSATSPGLGQGSEFVVRLPLHLPAETASPPAPARGFEALPRGLRVMVVDDNQDSADMLSLSLKMMGHEVQALYDPLLVEDAAQRFRPDLVFLDVGMPVLNGFALAERLNKLAWPDGRRPRLVALTGWGQAEDRRRSEEAGFDEHLVKPADLDTIERVCRLVLASHAADAEAP